MTRPGAHAASLQAFLHYRRVHQGEAYARLEMTESEGRFRAAIPSDCTASPFPLQYFFELRASPTEVWFYPGLAENLCGPPYFVVRAAAVHRE